MFLSFAVFWKTVSRYGKDLLCLLLPHCFIGKTPDKKVYERKIARLIELGGSTEANYFMVKLDLSLISIGLIYLGRRTEYVSIL